MDVDVERGVGEGERSELMSETQEDEVDGIWQSKTSGLFHKVNCNSTVHYTLIKMLNRCGFSTWTEILAFSTFRSVQLAGLRI